MQRKIGIISIHYGVNFGSALQAVALYRYLKELSPDSYIEIINYIPPRFKEKQRIKDALRGCPKDVARKTIRLLRFEYIHNKYKRYLLNNTNISEPIYTLDDLYQQYKNFNLLIAGSDQIWNSDYNQGVDKAYFLQFASEGTTKVAYAASCGKDAFNEGEWKLIKRYLADFKAISLREWSAVKMITDAGIECSFVLDPTFLFNLEQWGKYEKIVTGCPEKFLLIYFLDVNGVNGKEIIKLAKNFATDRGLKTVLIINGQSRNALRNYNVDFIAHNLTPDYYIWLFRHASFVVTNSFHGVSFSINMERQFVALKREKYNTRLDSILSAMGLMDRYVDLNDVGIVQDIDYTEVNQRKSVLLNRSKIFIENAIQL